MKKTPKKSTVVGATTPGGLYDRHGPIPVAEAHESDTDSAWALFEETMMLQDNPDTKLEDLRPSFEDTKQDLADFEPTGFQETKAAPLKP